MRMELSEPSCSLELLKRQHSVMSEYLYLLEVQAKIEEEQGVAK